MTCNAYFVWYLSSHAFFLWLVLNTPSTLFVFLHTYMGICYLVLHFTQDYNVLFYTIITAKLFSSTGIIIKDKNNLIREILRYIWLTYESRILFYSLSKVLLWLKHNNVIATIVTNICTLFIRNVISSLNVQIFMSCTIPLLNTKFRNA